MDLFFVNKVIIRGNPFFDSGFFEMGRGQKWLLFYIKIAYCLYSPNTFLNVSEISPRVQ